MLKEYIERHSVIYSKRLIRRNLRQLEDEHLITGFTALPVRERTSEPEAGPEAEPDDDVIDIPSILDEEDE